MRLLLNREKALFAGGLLGLCLACAWALARSPEACDPGSHRVRLSAPERLEVLLPAPGPLDVSGGRNPFDRWHQPHTRSVRETGQRQDRQVDENGQRRRREEVLRALREWSLRQQQRQQRQQQQQETVETGTRTARIWEVPASFRGVLRPPGGRWRVILEAKRGEETRSLFEGEVWPDLNLRILRITSDSVLLENVRGKRFLMPDLYRSRAEGSRRDSAQAEPRD
ncbi:MAG: hypothetical protein ACYTGB_19295 [Planctomycetota bacterium]|jgi:hypothetical protein